ncbi:hypothetical protein OG394_28865 [Kribbella sp. NBC_01245]|uniref:hypothetical protein n=1 Tax=Kribbella sp. NBC_01245 TaxID=2903578 RepID=UPI002E2D8A52|nr:hypothetical protein [Kribbella sp. NBC_01245]
MGVLRTVAAVLGIMVLGGGSGYAAGHIAGQERDDSRAQPEQTPSVTPSHTPSSPRTRYPVVGGKMPALDLDDIVFVERNLELTGEVESDVKLEVPRGWRDTLQPGGDEVRFTKQGPDPRFIRVVAGFSMVETPLSRAARERKNVADTLTYENDPKVDPVVAGAIIGTDGEKRLFQSFRYTFISQSQGLKLVIYRYVAFEGNPNVAVMMAVSGMPKDEKALTGVLDRATKTVVRSN